MLPILSPGQWDSRLIKLLQELRLHSPPVTADVLAESMGLSQRTIYRDIESLREAGAIIDGAAGYGYSLTEDPALLPQVFTHEEIEALVLGLREVQAVATRRLQKPLSMHWQSCMDLCLLGCRFT